MSLTISTSTLAIFGDGLSLSSSSFAGSSILYHLIDIRSENSHYRERAVVSDEYLTGSGFSYDLNWLNAERVPNPEID